VDQSINQSFAIREVRSEWRFKNDAYSAALMHQKVGDEDREEDNMIEQRLWIQKLVFERGEQEGTTSALDQVEAGQARENSSWEYDGSNGSA
jgi:hypothetical protein